MLNPPFPSFPFKYRSFIEACFREIRQIRKIRCLKSCMLTMHIWHHSFRFGGFPGNSGFHGYLHNNNNNNNNNNNIIIIIIII